MIPPEFDYHAPGSIPDAIGLLGRLGDEAKLLAGGHSLLPMMKLRFAQPAHLIDLARSPSCAASARTAARSVIGAMTTENELSGRSCSQDKCRCWSKARGRSPIRRCATRAPSAATSRMAIRATIIRR